MEKRTKDAPKLNEDEQKQTFCFSNNHAGGEKAKLLNTKRKSRENVIRRMIMIAIGTVVKMNN